MTKKGLLVLVLAAFVASGLFAVDLSAGFGGNFTATFDSYKYDGEDAGSSRTIGGGFFGYFDATYVEANIGLLFGGLKLKIDGNWTDDSINVSYLTLGLFGKYPIDLDGFTLSPMLGIQYDIGLSAKFDGEDMFDDSSERSDFMNRFWIKLGISADINLTEQLYLRPSFLYGINFGSKDDRDDKKDNSDLSSFHHGLDVRVAIGFRF